MRCARDADRSLKTSQSTHDFRGVHRGRWCAPRRSWRATTTSAGPRQARGGGRVAPDPARVRAPAGSAVHRGATRSAAVGSRPRRPAGRRWGTTSSSTEVRSLRRTNVSICGAETRALQGVIAKASSMDSERSRRRSATCIGCANGTVVLRRLLTTRQSSRRARHLGGNMGQTPNGWRGSRPRRNVQPHHMRGERSGRKIRYS